MLHLLLATVALALPAPQTQDSGFEERVLAAPAAEAAAPAPASPRLSERVAIVGAPIDLAAIESGAAEPLRFTLPQDKKDAKKDEAKEDDFDTGLDRTRRRYLVSLRFFDEEKPLDAALYGWAIAATGHIKVSDDVALQGSAELPVVRFEQGNTNLGNDWGLGDIAFEFAALFETSYHVRHAIGLNYQVNSSTDDTLGDNAALVQPFYAASFLLDDKCRFEGNIAYLFSWREESGVENVGLARFRGRMIFGFTDLWYVSPEAELDIDVHRHGSIGGVFRFEAGKNFVLPGSRHLGVFGNVQFPLDNYTRDNVFEVVYSVGVNIFL